MTYDQIKTPADVRMFYESRNETARPRYFFTRDTMRFFGDTMRSFGVTRHDGAVYLYRKRTATVNIFGRHKKAGREQFNAWRLDPETYDLDSANKDTEAQIWASLYEKARKPIGETRALKHWK